jgi:hypothetical protein
MSLRSGKIADDLAPVWHEIPPMASTRVPEEGSFIDVTPDVWFVFDGGEWRIMTPGEHVEAERATFLSRNRLL